MTTGKGSQHYLEMSLQPIDVMREHGILTDWCLGNTIKYVLRAITKDPVGAASDIKKAIHCLEIYLEEIK